MIRINSLHKYFNKGRQNEIHVINNVNLELPEKGMVAIFGKSGCGKTTLLNVIGGLDGYASGSLTIENQDIGKNTDDIRNKYTGYIFQNYNLQPAESNFDNVANALRLCGITDQEEINERVMAALANVGMEKFAKRTPDTLSGGQQQRIAIARAIVKNPRIILADEPTGNLDEANTVMIMDLLKQIAQDHLVLLVTHEAHLVDYYCDMVIELSDGQVVGIRENAGAGGYAAKNKNHIYLGELEHVHLANENAEIEYYGDALQEPLKLMVVNSGGKLYLRIDTPKVQVLDDFSEVKLKEGVYEQESGPNSVSTGIDMSKLPPVEGKEFGRLFRWKSSVKSGYVSNFRKGKKGKKVLRRCMCMFAAVLVFMSALFGTAISDVMDAKEKFSDNVFFVYTPDGNVSDTLWAAMGDSDSGIDYLTLAPDGVQTYESDSAVFELGFFETFQTRNYSADFYANVVKLGLKLAKELPVVEGKVDNLRPEEIVITTAVADKLLERSPVGYITEYRDLLGLITTSVKVDNKNLRIGGIVESEEHVMYMSDLAIAKSAIQMAYTNVVPASEAGLDVKSGETVYFDGGWNGASIKEGATVKIHGKEFVVSRVMKYVTKYEEWLSSNDIAMDDSYTYFDKKMAEERPELVSDPDYMSYVEAATRERYGEYLEYYYSYGDAFLEDYYFFDNYNMDLWMAVEKDLFAAKCLFLDEDYFKATRYKGKTGEYISLSTLEEERDNLPYCYDEIDYDLYYQEFEAQVDYNQVSFSDGAYAVSEADYIELSGRYGETHDTASNGYYSEYQVYDPDTDSYVWVTEENQVFTLVHSSDPEKTEAFLKENFGDLDTGNEYIPALVTPDVIFDNITEMQKAGIVSNLITMVVFVAIMSVCMFFIMRSSLMSRIKEVGIYRAIGVSKKNLAFKFTVESAVLTTLTVFLGYLGSSAVIAFLTNASNFTKQFFYYPIWYALLVLAFLYAVCLFCGTLPVLMLLRKTPSEILAKYDI